VVQIADVEHAHEMAGADLIHLALNLFGDAVGIAGDEIAGAEKPVPVKLGKIAPFSVAFAEIIKRPFRR
jgi:hypothetical protein